MIIPALVDLSEYPSEPKAVISGGVTLLYIGSPAGKDQLGVVLDAIEGIPLSKRQGLRLVIAGPERRELEMNPDVGGARLDRLGGVVEVRGFVLHEHVPQLLSEADFTVLLRPTGGYADAGFPTKVPESLAAGCPVLGNITSDLGTYLTDGENAVVCEVACGSSEVSVATVRQAILRIIGMTAEERLAMRRRAQLSARPLSSTAWGSRLADYLEDES
jgi:glycosyltransferase involved in cell wall biosynthesis